VERQNDELRIVLKPSGFKKAGDLHLYRLNQRLNLGN
jgi:hypothetical protein